jgi:hypothetical protein
MGRFTANKIKKQVVILQIERCIEQSTTLSDVIKLLPKIQKSVFDVWNAPVNPNVFV